MGKIQSVLLVIAGIIHLVPLSGALGSAALSRLYGVAMDDSSLTILMQHRAILFGLLGALLIVAAFRSTYLSMALIAGLISAISFLVIAVMADGYNDAIRRVVLSDIVAVGCLVAAAVIHLWPASQPG